jgi:hypothetical protein
MQRTLDLWKPEVCHWLVFPPRLTTGPSAWRTKFVVASTEPLRRTPRSPRVQPMRVSTLIVTLLGLTSCVGESGQSPPHASAPPGICPSGTLPTVRDNEFTCIDGTGKRQGPFFGSKAGRIVEIGNYSDDKKDGAWITFSPQLMIRDVEQYRAGEITGSQVWFYDTGFVSEVRPTAEDSGPSCSFETDGSRVSAGFVQGKNYQGEWCSIVRGEASALRYSPDGTSSQLVSVETPP